MRLRALFAGVALIQACSTAQKSGSCQMAMSNGDLQSTLDPVTVGGYIDLVVRKSLNTQATETNRCVFNAYPHKEVGSRRWRMSFFFAKHCYHFDTSLVESLRLNFFDSKGKVFVTDLPFLPDFMKRRSEIESALRGIGMGDALPELSAALFGYHDPRDPVKRVSSSCLQQDEATLVNFSDRSIWTDTENYQILCFSSTDLDKQLGEVDFSQTTDAEYESLRSRFQDQIQPENPGRVSEPKALALVQSYSNALLSLSARSHEYPAVLLAEFEISGCRERESDEELSRAVSSQFHKPKGERVGGKKTRRELSLEVLSTYEKHACANKQEFLQALKPFYSIRGKDGAEVLSSLGYDIRRDPIELFDLSWQDTPMGKAYLGTNWHQYNDQSKKLIELNTVLDDGAGNFSYRAIKDIPAEDVLDANGTLYVVIPRAQALPSFGRTDSGSLLSFYGLFPLGVLSTVDREPVTAGASITPLPTAGSTTVAQRGSRRSSEGESEAEANPGSPFVSAPSGTAPAPAELDTPPSAADMAAGQKRPTPGGVAVINTGTPSTQNPGAGLPALQDQNIGVAPSGNGDPGRVSPTDFLNPSAPTVAQPVSSQPTGASARPRAEPMSSSGDRLPQSSSSGSRRDSATIRVRTRNGQDAASQLENGALPGSAEVEPSLSSEDSSPRKRRVPRLPAADCG